MDIITILTAIGGACGAVITIIGFITLLMKKPKEWIKTVAQETYKAETKEIMECLKDIKERLDIQQKADVSSLRHSITRIYEEYKNNKTLPSNVKEDLCSLYENYLKLGGNSYVKQITNEMLSWKVE